MLGIKVCIKEHNFPGEGYITGYRGRAYITVRPGTTHERQRFTICHEIAHTCFPDAFEMGRSRGAPDESAAIKKFEWLCDVGAAELLMPFEDFGADMAGRRISLGLAESLGIRYGASVEATIRRLVGLTNQPCAAVFLTDEKVAEHEGWPGVHRIRSFTPSDSFGVFTKPGTLAPHGSCIYSAAHISGGVPVLEKWIVQEANHDFYVEALLLPEFPGSPKVLGLLHRSHPD
jgi:hypothetical protein